MKRRSFMQMLLGAIAAPAIAKLPDVPVRDVLIYEGNTYRKVPDFVPFDVSVTPLTINDFGALDTVNYFDGVFAKTLPINDWFPQVFNCW